MSSLEVTPYSIEDVRKAQNEHNWERYYSLKPYDVYVEAGAFWGKYGMIASLKGCKVILIEPEPSNILTLKQVVNVENLRNITIVEKAVGNKKGKTKFHINSLEASHIVDDIIGDNIAEVDIDTIDNILNTLDIEYVDLLCCDVEGSEIDLIKGADKYFTERRIKNVAIACYHNSEYNKIAVEILQSYGFKNLVYEEGIVYGYI